MGQVLFTSEEPHEWPAPQCDMVADCAAQHRVAGLERVQDRPQRDRTLDLEPHLAVHTRERPQMNREPDSYHVKRSRFPDGRDHDGAPARFDVTLQMEDLLPGAQHELAIFNGHGE